MNNLQIFSNPEFGKVRIVDMNGEPWLVGKDVAEALGYQNPSKALADHVHNEDKLNNESLLSLGQRGGWLINESGLYSLVLSSKLPGARRFRRWVTNEVLPSIRQHGAYMTSDTIDKMIASPDFGIQLLTALREEQRKRKVLEDQAEKNHPKVLFAEAVTASKSSVLVGELAKLLRQNGVAIGQNRLFAWLRENGYLISRRGSDYNMPTQKSMELGLFEIKERTMTDPDGFMRITKTPKCTGKGQLYFINRFLDEQEGNTQLKPQKGST